jgi:hypothetical protein
MQASQDYRKYEGNDWSNSILISEYTCKPITWGNSILISEYTCSLVEYIFWILVPSNVKEWLASDRASINSFHSMLPFYCVYCSYLKLGNLIHGMCESWVCVWYRIYAYNLPSEGACEWNSVELFWDWGAAIEAYSDLVISDKIVHFSHIWFAYYVTNVLQKWDTTS